MRKLENIVLLIIVFLIIFLIMILLTQGKLHYWALDKQGIGLLFSIGSCVIRLGNTP